LEINAQSLTTGLELPSNHTPPPEPASFSMNVQPLTTGDELTPWRPPA
jgi:hypothetical protein